MTNHSGTVGSPPPADDLSLIYRGGDNFFARPAGATVLAAAQLAPRRAEEVAAALVAEAMAEANDIRAKARADLALIGKRAAQLLLQAKGKAASISESAAGAQGIQNGAHGGSDPGIGREADHPSES